MEVLAIKHKAVLKALVQLEKALGILKENKYPDMYETARDSLIRE